MSDPKIDSSFISSSRTKEIKGIQVIHSLAKQVQMDFHKSYSYTGGQWNKLEGLHHIVFQAYLP